MRVAVNPFVARVPTPLVVILPFLMIAEIDLVGRLTLADVACLILLPLFIIRRSVPRLLPAERYFYFFAVLWLLSLVFTDLYRETPFEQYARGWAKIFLLIINYTTIRCLIGRNLNRAILFVFLLLLAGAIKLKLGIGGVIIDGGFFGNAWKFGYGQFFTALIFLTTLIFFSMRNLRPLVIILPFFSAALNLLLGARNLFGVSALAALSTILPFLKVRTLTIVQMCFLLGILAVTGWGTFAVYKYAASEGILGADAKQKYEYQSSGSLGILLSGRHEILASSQAIMDSPLIGYGSWARSRKYVELMLSRLRDAGERNVGTPISPDEIPTHSHLMGGWVEAGILGAAFWFWALWVTGRGVYTAVRWPSDKTGFVVFIGVSLLWDILFSPFGLDRRIIVPAELYLMIVICWQREDWLEHKRRN